MWNLLWPMLIVICANTIYNITTKSTPADISPFASLTVTYTVAAVSSLLLFFITAENRDLAAELTKTNWTAFALGIAIVALEFGFICIYRAGWKISIASLVANISLACILLLIGILIYRETISVRQIIGMFLSAVGLILIAK